jgi:hypothetical protein
VSLGAESSQDTNHFTAQSSRALAPERGAPCSAHGLPSSATGDPMRDSQSFLSHPNHALRFSAAIGAECQGPRRRRTQSMRGRAAPGRSRGVPPMVVQEAWPDRHRPLGVVAPDPDGNGAVGLLAAKRRGSRLRSRSGLLPDRPGWVMEAKRGHCKLSAAAQSAPVKMRRTSRRLRKSYQLPNSSNFRHDVVIPGRLSATITSTCWLARSAERITLSRQRPMYRSSSRAGIATEIPRAQPLTRCCPRPCGPGTTDH